MLECAPEAAVAELSKEEQEMLKSPEERWASLDLPSVVKSQKNNQEKRKTKNKWGQRLQGSWHKSRSKHWQTMSSLEKSHRPVPHAKRSDKMDQDDDQFEQQNQSKLSKRPRLWKVCQKRSGGSKTGAGKKPAQQEAWEPVEDSEWIREQVRTVGESLPTSVLNRTWWVTAVRRSKASGELQFRLTDLSCAVAYARPSEVVKVAADVECTASGPAVLHYGQFKPPMGKALAAQLCNSLGRDVQLATQGELIEQTTLSWALQVAPPLHGSSFPDRG